MKATDLMIGDWVMSDNEHLKVLDILTYNIVADNTLTLYYFDELEPILLTGEMLKNNGFELVSDSDRAKALIEIYDLWECNTISQTIYVRYYKKRKDYSLYTIDCNINQIMYVHELQNAMRVCGVEKEIEL